MKSNLFSKLFVGATFLGAAAAAFAATGDCCHDLDCCLQMLACCFD